MSDPDHLAAGNQPLWDAAADGLVLVDPDGTILATNTAFDEMFGYHGNELIGSEVEVLVPREVRALHASLRDEFEATRRARPMAASRDLEGRRADGSTFPIAVSLGQLPTPVGPRSLATVRDVTDRVRIETAAATVRRQHAMALERERIANDLHDTVIQRLFALGLSFEGLATRIADDGATPKILNAVDTIDDIIDDIRSTIYGLRHRISSRAPLRDQIFAIVDEMQPSLGFAPTIIISGTLDLPPDSAVSEHLVAVLREGLSNTARHSGATAATVTVALDEGRLGVEVVDNGIGVREDVQRSGLANLADRAVALDGTFEIRRHSPSGTVLRWSVPAAES